MLNGSKIENTCSYGSMKASGPGALALRDAKPGRRFRVAGIEGGRGICSRMAAMGIYPGVEMEVVCSGYGCSYMVRVHGSTLSLGKGVSDKIFVTTVA
jgi:ferrous iron transport protein A